MYLVLLSRLLHICCSFIYFFLALFSLGFVCVCVCVLLSAFVFGMVWFVRGLISLYRC